MPLRASPRCNWEGVARTPPFALRAGSLRTAALPKEVDLQLTSLGRWREFGIAAGLRNSRFCLTGLPVAPHCAETIRGVCRGIALITGDALGESISRPLRRRRSDAGNSKRLARLIHICDTLPAPIGLSFRACKHCLSSRSQSSASGFPIATGSIQAPFRSFSCAG
jgi:hypothetical protein